jgi:hypothetical protein
MSSGVLGRIMLVFEVDARRDQANDFVVHILKPQRIRKRNDRHTYCISHTSDNGVVMLGTQDWADYDVSSRLMFSLHERGVLVLRSKGHRRYYGAVISGGGSRSANHAEK